MSLSQVVEYEPKDEVEKKSLVAKKAMAEVIAAKWLSMNPENELILRTSQVPNLPSTNMRIRQALTTRSELPRTSRKPAETPKL